MEKHLYFFLASTVFFLYSLCCFWVTGDYREEKWHIVKVRGFLDIRVDGGYGDDNVVNLVMVGWDERGREFKARVSPNLYYVAESKNQQIKIKVAERDIYKHPEIEYLIGCYQIFFICGAICLIGGLIFKFLK